MKIGLKPCDIDYYTKYLGPLELFEYRTSASFSQERKSTVVESLLIRMPLPIIYIVDKKPANCFGMIDSLCGFINNEFCLRRLKYLLDLEDQYFKDLVRPLQRRIEETNILVHIFNRNRDGSDEMIQDLNDRVEILLSGRLRSNT